MAGVQIHLNSKGGSLIGGILLGEAIREMQFNTVVSTSHTKEIWDDGIHLADNEFNPISECSSACVFAFVGGRIRYASNNTPSYEVGFRKIGRLGVHQFYDPEAILDPSRLSRSAFDQIEDQLVVSMLLNHFDKMGISATVLQLASRTLPDDMHYLAEAELVELGLDNYSTHKLQLRGYKNGVVVIELEFSRNTADFRVEIYCARNQMRMLVNAEWPRDYDVVGHKNWNYFAELSLMQGLDAVPIQLKKVQEKFIDNANGRLSGVLDFVFEGAPLSKLVKLKQFSFSDFSSRYADNAAKEISFSLPSDFDGLYLLPKTCL